MRLQLESSRNAARKKATKNLVPLEMEGEESEGITPIRRMNRNRRFRRVVLPDLFQDDEPIIEEADSD